MSTRGNPVPDAVGCELRRSAACDYCGNRKYPMQTNLRPRHLDDGRKHSRRDSCACWFRKIAAMAWYRVELERPPQLPPVQDFLECHPNLNPQMLSPEILVSVGHPSLRRAESQRARSPACCSCPSRAVTRCSEGVLLSYCELSKRQGDAPTTATIRRFTARPGCSCWLLFAVIPPPL
jgi:hypothetical protein